MSVRRKTTKRDDNHGEVVKALEAVGAVVIDLAEIGEGCPDIAVLFRGQTYWLEIKDGSKSPSRRELTPQQFDFHGRMRYVGVEPYIVLHAYDALRAIGATS